MMKEVL
jgi:regulator of replication initiation timing